MGGTEVGGRGTAEIGDVSGTAAIGVVTKEKMGGSEVGGSGTAVIWVASE